MFISTYDLIFLQNSKAWYERATDAHVVNIYPTVASVCMYGRFVMLQKPAQPIWPEITVGYEKLFVDTSWYHNSTFSLLVYPFQLPKLLLV